MHDHRGVGLSSRNVPIPNLETRVADALTILDAVSSERAVLSGLLASGAVNALLSVTRPERVSALVWTDPEPRTAWAPDNPWGRTAAELEQELAGLRFWGTSAYGPAFASEQESHGNRIPEVEAALFAKASRNACTPDVAIDLARMWAETDVRAILPSIPVPALILAETAIGAVDQARRGGRPSSPGSEFREVSGEAWSVSMVMAAVEEIRRLRGRGAPARRARHGAGDGPLHRYRRVELHPRPPRRRSVEVARRAAPRDRP